MHPTHRDGFPILRLGRRSNTSFYCIVASANPAIRVAVHFHGPIAPCKSQYFSSSALQQAMPPKPKKVRETFNALGVTGGAPKFKQQTKSTRKPTSWERKALKAAKAQEGGDLVTATNSKIDQVQPRAPVHQTFKRPQGAKADVKRQQRTVDSSSGSSSSSVDESSDASSSSDEESDREPKNKGASSPAPSKTKKSKKEKVVSITFEHFPVQERDFHGISVSATRFVSHISRGTRFSRQIPGTIDKFFGWI